MPISLRDSINGRERHRRSLCELDFQDIEDYFYSDSRSQYDLSPSDSGGRADLDDRNNAAVVTNSY